MSASVNGNGPPHLANAPNKKNGAKDQSERQFGLERDQWGQLVLIAADGQRLGVLQVVNKQHGSFDAADESHLRSLASQMGVTLDYTALFDQVLRMKSHNESMLRSLTKKKSGK